MPAAPPARARPTPGPWACLCAALLSALPAWGETPEAWKVFSEDKGARFERRDVAGSSYPELRVTKDVPQAPAQVLEAVWRRLTDSTSIKDHKKTLLRSGPDEVVIYQQISVPVVSNRDYTVRIWKTLPAPDGIVEVRYQTANHLGPALDSKYVRLETIRGGWTLTPLPGGGTRVSYLAYSEAGGSVPASFARGAQRDRHAQEFWGVVDGLPPVAAKAPAREGPGQDPSAPPATR
jgi:hypothetical protein